ncbi:hypothetical protein NQ315_014806 [Exocentrus adspersus]|uniref:Uncharacterized protein n=1 Tax=Exocentrus adspersus TaxID=1586481 RepID=A0AAV8VM33_9CUCU|nr:hypothetical protein NQ315_014806 [Exocentrus adspersus]
MSLPMGELPKEIQLKHAVVNIRNNDYFGFAYSIMSCLYPTQQNANHISSYPDFRDVLHFTGINFPVTIEQIPKFENLNGISVNVYTLKLNGGKYSVLPAYVTRKKLDRHANLLLIQNKNKTKKYQKHQAFTLGYYFHCTYDKNLAYYKSYESLDSVKRFFKGKIVISVKNLFKRQTIPLDIIVRLQGNLGVEPTPCNLRKLLLPQVSSVVKLGKLYQIFPYRSSILSLAGEEVTRLRSAAKTY